MNLQTTRPVLEFSAPDEKLTDALSAVVLIREELWVASDELTSVERLTLRGGGLFGGHRSFELQGPLSLPATGKKKPDGKKVDQEIDLEGLDFDGQYLWLVGSHSIKRKKVDEEDRDDGDEKNIKKLSKTDAEGNRFLLARVPVVEDARGESVLVGVSLDGALKAAQLPGTVSDNALTRAILEKDDEDKLDLHLSASLSLPGKDNGFDIEGIAVAGEKVFLGLRGPVLRGWAIVLELHPADDGASELRLKKIGSKGRAYRKHFLDLGGLGIRDLCVDGQDLLVLAGPTMNLDGPVRLFRWPGGVAKNKETVVWADELEKRALTIPHGDGSDHAEGMALIAGSNPKSILVVYDAPSEERRVGDRALRADIFGLP
jgi:Protein of unknown function (DUF3616)